MAIPLVIALTALVAVCYFSRRREQRAQHNSNRNKPYPLDKITSFPHERKPELYTGLVDLTIAGPVRKKPELSTERSTPLPPELHNTVIAEVDTNNKTGKRRNTKRKPVATISTTNSQGGLEPPLVDPHAKSATRTSTTQSTDAELIEEADAAVQELGLLAMRKKTLITQANVSNQRPEEVEGRKGEEYRELVQREEKVRKRLEDIEADRRN